MLDFELAMIRAVKSVFKRSTIKCCKFHLGRSWWRKLKEMGLSTSYKNRKSSLSKWLRGIFALSLLPPSEVYDIFKEYTSSKFLKSRTNQVKQFVS